MNPTNSPIPPVRRLDGEKIFWKECPICYDTEFLEPEFLTCCQTPIHRYCWEQIRDTRQVAVND